MFNVVVSKVIVTRFKLQKCLIAAFRANINRESQKFYTIAEKKKESIRSSAMERTKKNECIHSSTMKQTKKNKCIRSSTMKRTKKNEGIPSSTIDVMPLLVYSPLCFQNAHT
jgi:chromatin remodeling complex protein RSC6